MNVTNLTRLADLLESPEAEGHFDIGTWFSYKMPSRISGFAIRQQLHNCGTTACIGGWAAALGGEEGTIGNAWSDKEVREWMGLPETGAYWSLCYAYPTESITPKQAARVIRNLIATGSVDWSILSEEI